MLLWLVALSSWVTVALAVFVCPEPVTLNGTPVSLPRQYIKDRKYCIYTFNVPDQEFAEVSVSAFNLASGSIKVETIYDTIGNQGRSEFRLNTTLPGNQIKIILDTANDMMVLFEYSIRNIRVDLPPSNPLDVKAKEPAVFLRFKKDADSFTVVSDSRISLIANAPPRIPHSALLNVFLYEGNGTTKTPLGSLSSIFNRHCIVNATNVIFYVTRWTEELADFIVIANHPSNVEQCTDYWTTWSYPSSPEDSSTVTMSPRDGLKCLTILNEYDEELDTTLKQSFSTSSRNAPIFMDVNVTENYTGFDAFVIAGAPVANYNSTMLGKFASPPSFTYPQLFPGYARTLMVRNGSVRFQFSTAGNNEAKAINMQAYNGRQGYIMSNNYLMSEKDQNVDFSLISDAVFNLTLKVVDSDVTQNAIVNVRGEGEAIRIILTDSGDVSKTWTFQEQYVQIVSNFTQSKAYRGTLLRYSIQMKENSTTATPTSSTTTTGNTLETDATTAATPTIKSTTITTKTPETTTKGASAITSLLALMIAVVFL